MNSLPIVSVIVATYNRAELLNMALQTAIFQDLTNIEVLVIGDGCDDNSAEVVAALNDSRFSWQNLSKNHRAPHAAHNLGMELATGKYIAYLNHDDLWFPWHLRRLVECIEQRNADFAYDMLCMIRQPELGPVCIGPVPHFRQTVFGIPSGWLHRNPLLDGSISWQSPYRAGQATDSDFIARASSSGAVMCYQPVLGALKFGSSTWGSYASKDFAQTGYLERLKADPGKLQLELLQQSASTMSVAEHYAPCSDTTATLIGRLLRHWAWQMIHAYGKQRFPLPAIRRLWFRRARRKMNQRRGLNF